MAALVERLVGGGRGVLGGEICFRVDVQAVYGEVRGGEGEGFGDVLAVRFR